MARYLGIDIGTTQLRLAVVRTAYRKTLLEQVITQERAQGMDLPETLRALLAPFIGKVDSINFAFEGEELFFRRFELPVTARRVLREVLPFEIEAQVPLELADTIYDYRALATDPKQGKFPVVAVIGHREAIEARNAMIASASVGSTAMLLPSFYSLLPLASVSAALREPGPYAIVDLGASRTEVAVVQQGELRFGRTLSVGVARLPESTEALARELALTHAGWRSQGGAPWKHVHLVGGGALLPGAMEFFADRLKLPVSPFAPEGLQLAAELTPESLPTLAKSLGLALASTARARVLQLRSGRASFEQELEFLRERIPLLAGLGTVLLLSIVFSTWSHFRALSREKATLTSALEAVTKEVLSESLSDPEKVNDILEKSTATTDDDPEPKMDSFDVLYRFNEAIPKSIKHDINEFDCQRSTQSGIMHVVVNGEVPKVQDAEDLATALKAVKCFQDVKTVRVSQAVGSDAQKYHIEWDVRCLEPSKTPKGSGSAAGDASAAPSGATGGEP